MSSEDWENSTRGGHKVIEVYETDAGFGGIISIRGTWHYIQWDGWGRDLDEEPRYDLVRY